MPMAFTKPTFKILTDDLECAPDFPEHLYSLRAAISE